MRHIAQNRCKKRSSKMLIECLTSASVPTRTHKNLWQVFADTKHLYQIFLHNLNIRCIGSNSVSLFCTIVSAFFVDLGQKFCKELLSEYSSQDKGAGFEIKMPINFANSKRGTIEGNCRKHLPKTYINEVIHTLVSKQSATNICKFFSTFT